jgi:hypothetical protein
MKRQQCIEHRQGALGHGEARPRRANRPKHVPFMREFFRRPRFRGGLCRAALERENAPVLAMYCSEL